ncbi:MAG: hypothetical protein JWQ27_1115 [Ferruginibacter sp.]|nr:hypothetical protein [Ferruginibacter sp.]
MFLNNACSQQAASITSWVLPKANQNVLKMKFFDRQLLLTSLLNCLFIIAFSGVFTFYFLFYTEFFNQASSEWYMYYEKEIMPDKLRILLSGFRDIAYIIKAVFISILFALSYRYALRGFAFKNKVLAFLVYTFTSMLMLSGFYAAYLILCQIPSNSYQREYMSAQLSLFLLLSIIPGVLNAIIYNLCKTR